jgi:hypothetical protein
MLIKNNAVLTKRDGVIMVIEGGDKSLPFLF